MDGQRLPGSPNEAYDGDERVRALVRGMEALTERVGRLEDAVYEPEPAAPPSRKRQRSVDHRKGRS
jgi:hypothetical protein